MPKTSHWHLLAALVFSLALFSTTATNAAEQSAKNRLAPSGTLRAAVIIANPVLVTHTPKGELAGVAVDLANALGAKLAVPVRFVPYENIVRYNQSIGKDEWDVGFAPRDLSRVGQLALTDSFMDVDHSYLAAAGTMLNTLDEVDRPGIRVAVAQGSATDGYLIRTLKNAHIVRLLGGVLSAREALSSHRVEVYADYTSVIYSLQTEVPGSTVLVEPFDRVHMSIAIPKSNADALPLLNDFIHDANRDGSIAEAIKRAGLVGVRPGR